MGEVVQSTGAVRKPIPILSQLLLLVGSKSSANYHIPVFLR
jgi:hypothetical protein